MKAPVAEGENQCFAIGYHCGPVGDTISVYIYIYIYIFFFYFFFIFFFSCKGVDNRAQI
jgi:hypothetical protein